MHIRIVKPDPEKPLVWVHVDVTTNTDSEGLNDFLDEKRITLLGRWETHMVSGFIDSVKAPALLEDEHVKPRKKRSK